MYNENTSKYDNDYMNLSQKIFFRCPTFSYMDYLSHIVIPR